MVALTQFMALVTILAATVSAAPTPIGRAVNLKGTKKGQATFFDPGLGSCGIKSNGNQNVVAVSTEIFDKFPGAGANPNRNPICGKTVTAHLGGKSVTAKIVDRCVGCATNDLDLSPAAFSKLASKSKGRVNITWKFN